MIRLLLFFCLAASSAAPKARILILTDISSLEARVREPDDGQSLIRLLLFSNDFDIEGLIPSSNMGHGQVVRPELIRQAVEAYAQVRPNLLKHNRNYPAAEYLIQRIKSGQPVAGPRLQVSDSIGPGKDTEASRWIVSVVDRPDPRPVWVTIWGGSADLAQALFSVRNSRTSTETDQFLRKLRVHAVYDQDSTGPWIRENFPGLFYITRRHGIRGMYRGGDTSLVSVDWVETNIRTGHGPLGSLYPNYDGGDIWARDLGRVRGIKEGDTPSYLSLIPNGLNDPERPGLGGWGGLMREVAPNRWEDGADEPDSRDRAPEMSSVHRWRSAFQSEFAARLDWCVQPFDKANHPPVPKIAGQSEIVVKSGRVVRLDASKSTDPDGDKLVYEWSFYPFPEMPVEWRTARTRRGEFVAPAVSKPTALHVLLTVRDDREPSLRRYRRIRVNVTP